MGTLRGTRQARPRARPSKSIFPSGPVPPMGNPRQMTFAEIEAALPGQAVTSVEAPVPEDRIGQGPRDLRPGGRPAAGRHGPALGLRRDPARRDPGQGHPAHADEPLVVREDLGDHREPPSARPGGANSTGAGIAEPRPPAAQHGRAQAEAPSDRMRRPGLPCGQRMELIRAARDPCAASRSRRACGRPTALPEPIFTPTTKAPKGSHDEAIDDAAGRRGRWAPRSTRGRRRRASRSTASATTGPGTPG